LPYRKDRGFVQEKPEKQVTVLGFLAQLDSTVPGCIHLVDFVLWQAGIW
jgi:hypothetical protein